MMATRAARTTPSARSARQRRANLVLAVVLGLVALFFYAGMFFWNS
ncbi:MAG: hypothetical protein H6983_20135 [Ectothiorhodospiraceae bacterium]|nr:hypothetical protein [Ectothiorhodospiraceae bacterium]